MSCPEVLTTLRYFRGELSDAAARRSMQHVHACTQCRHSFREAAASFANSGPGEEQRTAHPEFDQRGFATPVGEMTRSASPPRAGLRNQRLMLVVIAGAAILFLKSQGSGSAPESAPVDPARECIARGSPFCQCPSGAQEGRPRVIAGLLPASVAAGRILILDAAGSIVFDRAFTAGEEGCMITAGATGAGKERLAANEVVIPFPDAEVLPLKPGAPYGVAFLLPGGHLGESSVFTL